MKTIITILDKYSHYIFFLIYALLFIGFVQEQH